MWRCWAFLHHFKSEVLQALNPKWALNFFMEYKRCVFFALGAVVLSITGVEALYADMGHFGKFPIRGWFTAWCCHRWCSTTSAGALLQKNPGRSKTRSSCWRPTGRTVHSILATTATVIASQAVISGVFSLTESGGASWLSVADAHHSHLGNGIRRIYIPVINWTLYISVVLVIIGFEHSSNLAAALASRSPAPWCDQHSGHLGGDQQLALESLHGDRHRDILLIIDVPMFSQRPEAVLGGWLPRPWRW